MSDRVRTWMKRAIAVVIFCVNFAFELGVTITIEQAPEGSLGIDNTDLTAQVGGAACIIILIATTYVALLLVLPKPEIGEHSRSPALAYVFYHLSVLVGAAAVGGVLFGSGILGALARRGLLPEGARPLFDGAPVPVGIVAAVFYSFYRAYRLPTASTVVTIDNRPPIVYLRSFGDELKYSIRMGYVEAWRASKLRLFFPLITLETGFAEIAKKYGPLVALGKPNQLIPVEGAARDWVEGDWESGESFLI